MPKKLKAKQYKAAQMVANGETDDYITYKLKLKRNTLKRWRRLPEFYQAVQYIIEDMQSATQYNISLLELMSVATLGQDYRNSWGNAAERKQKLELFEYCRNLPKETAQNGSKQLQTDPNGSERSETDPNGPERLQNDPNSSEQTLREP